MRNRIFSILALCLFCVPQLVQAASSSHKKPTSFQVVRMEVDTPLDHMQPGLNVGASLDLQVLTMQNTTFSEGSDWYGYPLYRLVLASLFPKEQLGFLIDLEKPGYANRLYPFIKVNELYAQAVVHDFKFRVGRQQLGDENNLLLGVQADAFRVGRKIGILELDLFYALTRIDVPWNTGGEIESMAGFLPTLQLGNIMNIKGYALAGMEAITITSGTPAVSRDSENYIIILGGQTTLNLKLESGELDFDAQVGYQMASAKTIDDDAIDATGLGAKMDATYHQRLSKNLAFKIKGQVTYTSGDPEPTVNTTTGFSSLNTLPGSGPGLFAKLEDGGGANTFIDSHSLSALLQPYKSVIAAGISGEMIMGSFQPGVGYWYYLNTNNDGQSYGMEFNEWIIFRATEWLSFYQQAALFIPNKDGIGWPATATADPENAIKLVAGTSIHF